MVDLIRAKWRSHKNGAKHRGIDFLFTFEEWTTWWEAKLGPDWVSKRGTKKGQYVMARFGDKGPYHPTNVKCITHGDNSREWNHYEKSPKGQNVKNSIVTEEQATLIRTSLKSVFELSKELKIKATTVRNIRLGHCWKHLNAKYPPSTETERRVLQSLLSVAASA